MKNDINGLYVDRVSSFPYGSAGTSSSSLSVCSSSSISLLYRSDISIALLLPELLPWSSLLILVSVVALTLWSVLVLLLSLLRLLVVLLLGSGSLLGVVLLLEMHPFISPFRWVKSHLSLRLFCFSYFSIQNFFGWARP